MWMAYYGLAASVPPSSTRNLHSTQLVISCRACAHYGGVGACGGGGGRGFSGGGGGGGRGGGGRGGDGRGCGVHEGRASYGGDRY